MKKHLFISILLLTIGFRTFGWVLFSVFEIQEARLEMGITLQDKERESDLRHFSFAQKEFTRLRTRRNEFRFDGTLFDIKKMEIRGDSVFVTAISDEHESRALEHLATLFNLEKTNKQSPRNGFPATLAQFLLQPFLPGEGNIWQVNRQIDDRLPANFFLVQNISTALIPVLSPPPETLC